MKFNYVLYSLIVWFFSIVGAIFLVVALAVGVPFYVQFTLDGTLSQSGQHLVKMFRLILGSVGTILIGLTWMARLKKKEVLKLVSKTRFQNAIVLLLTVGMCLIIVEFGLRIALSDEVKYNSGPGQYQFEKKFIFLNKEGFRDTDHSVQNKEGKTRVAVVGDSFTVGWGVKEVDDTYPKLVEGMLNDGQKEKYEFIIFAKVGIDTEFEKKLIEKKVERYDPDVIVLGYVLNDFRDVDNGLQDNANPYLFWINKYLKGKSYVYFFLNKGIDTGLVSLDLKESYEERIVKTFNSKPNREFNRKLLSEVKFAADSQNATLIVMVFPFIYHLEDYPFEDAHQFVKEVGEEYGFEVIDLLGDFKTHRKENLVVSSVDAHPNELGHEIAAQALYLALNK